MVESNSRGLSLHCNTTIGSVGVFCFLETAKRMNKDKNNWKSLFNIWQRVVKEYSLKCEYKKYYPMTRESTCWDPIVSVAYRCCNGSRAELELELESQSELQLHSQLANINTINGINKIHSSENSNGAGKAKNVFNYDTLKFDKGGVITINGLNSGIEQTDVNTKVNDIGELSHQLCV